MKKRTKKFLTVNLAKKFLIVTIVFFTLYYSLSINTIAKSTESNADDEYIFFSDLFYAYPYYLSNDTYFKSYSDSIKNVYNTVHTAYQNSSLKDATGLDKALDSITSPTQIVSLITDTMGLTDFSYNDALDAANNMFVKNILSDSVVYSVEKAFGNTKKITDKLNTLIGYFNKLELENETGTVKYSAEFYVQSAFDFLQDKGMLNFLSDETLAQLFDEINQSNFKLSDCFNLASKEIDFAKAIISSILLEDTRLEIVDSILATQSSNTVLKDGMTRLKKQLLGNFITRFINNYLLEKVADKIFAEIDKLIVNNIIDSNISLILKIANIVFDAVIDAPSYETILKWQVLICYSNDLSNAISTLAQNYSSSILYSDDILNYESMFVAYDAVNKAAMGVTTDIARMEDPLGAAYRVFTEAVNKGIETVNIKTGQILFSLPSTTTYENVVNSLIISDNITIATQPNSPINLGKTIEISNGITTVKVVRKANLLSSYMHASISESNMVIDAFNDEYGDISLFGKHIESVKNTIYNTPKEDRSTISKSVYGSWEYTLDKNTKIRLQSDIIEKGCIYTFNGYILGNTYISGYTVPSGLNFGIDGYAVLGCWDTLTISENASLYINDYLSLNAWAYADAYHSKIYNYGHLNVKGKMYSYCDFYGTGHYVFNNVNSTIMNFNDATFEIRGTASGNAINCANTAIIISGDKEQMLSFSGSTNSLDVYTNKATLKAPSISNYIDFHGNDVNVTDSINILSSAKVVEGSNYKNLYFPEEYSLQNNITASYTFFNNELRVPSGNHIILNGNTEFGWGMKVIVEENSSLTITGDAMGREWAWQPKRTTISNSGSFTVLGTLMYYWNLEGDGIYNINNTRGPTISFSGSTLNISGKTASGNIVLLNQPDITICGTSNQSLGLTGAIKNLIITNNSGNTTFSTSINVKNLFNHNGNSFTLYNNGSGSSFIDYDEDGLLDHIDPNPTAGKLKTYTVNYHTNNGENFTYEYETVNGFADWYLPQLYQDNYIFDGWYIDAGFSTPVNSEIRVSRCLNVYAKWTSIFSYSLDQNNNLTITGINYWNSTDNLDIPKSINNYPVVAIGTGAFTGNEEISSIIIPEGLISIGDFAFNGTSIKQLKIPESVEYIGTISNNSNYNLLEYIDVSDDNKYYCDIDGILYNKDKTELINFPANNGITNYVIPDGVTKICEYAFAGCKKLISLSIPESLTHIANEAFRGNNISELHVTNLESWCNITFTNYTSSPFYSKKDNLYINLYINNILATEIEIPNTVKKINNFTFCGFASITNVNIPSSVVRIGVNAFSHCINLANIDIPDSVTSIGMYAFFGCDSLTNVTLPNKIKNIPLGTFSSCDNLTNIKISDNVEIIGNSAFSGCSNLTNITIPKKVTSIGNNVFKNCTNLNEIILPHSITVIGDCVFENCHNLNSVYVNKGSYTDTWLRENKLENVIKYPISLSQNKILITPDNNEMLAVIIDSDYSDNADIIWQTESAEIASIVNGSVYAKSVGKTLIKATTIDGMFFDICEVIVIPSNENGFMSLEGYQVREAGYNGLRSIFVVDLTKMPVLETDGLEVIEYGTIFASTDKLNSTGDEFAVTKNESGVYETVSYGKLITIMQNGGLVGKYISKNEENLVFACTVTNFTEDNFDKEVSIRGYAVLADADGNEYVVYCDYPNEGYRSVSLAMICDALAESGQITAENNISYAHVIDFRKKLSNSDNEVHHDQIFGTFYN